MKIQDLQSIFKRNMLAPGTDATIADYFIPAGRLNLNEAFQVYQESYITRLSDALADTFEAVKWVLGPDLFYDVCHRYIETHKSEAYHLSEYGDVFPEFLQAHSLSKNIPFLYDLARFEWTYKTLCHAATPRPLPLEKATESLKSRDVKIRFVAAFKIFKSPYAVHKVWSQRTGPAYLYEELDWNQAESLILYKKDGKVHITAVNETDAEILGRLQRGQSSLEALSDFAEYMDPKKIARLFQLVAHCGVIEDVDVSENRMMS